MNDSSVFCRWDMSHNTHGPRPRMGQHFLTRPEIAGWVADAIPLNRDDTVLEIGPGHGILTRELLARAGKVIAIEKDPALVAELRETFATDIAGGRLTLIEQDIRDFAPESCKLLGYQSQANAPIKLTSYPATKLSHSPIKLQAIMSADRSSCGRTSYKLVANIPYYITGYIIRKFLTTTHQPMTISVLIQKEVAERIVARDGKESLLSLSVKAYGTPRIVHSVKAGAFSPPPKVDSAVLCITDIGRTAFQNSAHEELFFTVMHKAFSSKRKSIGGTLKGLVPDEVFSACGIPKTARPEDVRFEAWLRLAKP